MCSCASCKYTDSFSGWKWDEESQKHLPDESGGFANWPRGNPAGPRSSAAAYAAHQRHCPPISKPYVPEKFGPPRYPINGYAGPLERMPQWWYAWNNRDWAALPVKASKPVLSVVPAAPKPELVDVAEFVRRKLAA